MGRCQRIYHHNYIGGISYKIFLHSKVTVVNNNILRGGCVVQMVECVPSMCETLNSNPSIKRGGEVGNGRAAQVLECPPSKCKALS
jgi:hypothetical protein